MDIAVAKMKGLVADVPTVMLTAHMDCVEPCANIKPVLKDGVIRSDGTTILGADDKAGVVAILETLRCLKEHDIPHGNLQIVFTVAEEGGVNGSLVGFCPLEVLCHVGVLSQREWMRQQACASALSVGCNVPSGALIPAPVGTRVGALVSTR